jgi:hypothetical protein
MFRSSNLKVNSKLPFTLMLATLFAVGAGTYIITCMRSASRSITEITKEPDEHATDESQIDLSFDRVTWLISQYSTDE